MAEDSYLNWQLRYAWFCYRRNISFIQALCTNLKLGNMNTFIHCALDFSNHSDKDLKSWTGIVGCSSLGLRSALRCPGAAGAAQLFWDTAEILSCLIPPQVPEQVLVSFQQHCSQMVNNSLLNKHCKGANPKDEIRSSWSQRVPVSMRGSGAQSASVKLHLCFICNSGHWGCTQRCKNCFSFPSATQRKKKKSYKTSK